MLRAATTKVGSKKTSNFTACRDLHGRRMRHVEAEQQIAEWNSTEHKVNEKEVQEKFRAIRQGKPIDRKECKFGIKCKYKWKCRNTHPDDEEREKEKLERRGGGKMIKLAASMSRKLDKKNTNCRLDMNN